MKRTELKRQKKRQPSDELREAMEAFKKISLGLPCAGCNGASFRLGYTKSHHVIYAQHLPVEYQWDTRNALPVCDDCHERHHNASRRILLSALTESNWAFARAVLGEHAEDYLRARYQDA